MTRLIHFGGDTGHVHAEGVTQGGSGTLTFDTGTKRSGTRSYKFDSTAGNVAVDALYDFNGAVATDYFLKFDFLLPAASGLPGSTVKITDVRIASDAIGIASVKLTAAGKIQFFNDQSGLQIGSDSTATITTDTWYRIEINVRVESAANDTVALRLDGTAVASTTANITTAAPDRFRIGWIEPPGASEVIFIDDVALNDGAGSVNNTWVGAEKVVLLVPTSDNTVNNWVTGTGGGSPIFGGADNIPPAGRDSALATASSQIENSTSAADNGFRANMTTYTTAGIGASDTVTAIYTLAEGGNSSLTGTDTIDIGVISNPAITQVSQSIDIDDGAYPTGWNRCVGTVSENPSVTKGTAPVMIVEKNVATTRVNTVCFMGMYVSYTVGVAAQPVYERDPRQSAVYRM